MITKRLVPIEAYQDEQGPLCRSFKEGRCQHLHDLYFEPGATLTFCNHDYAPEGDLCTITDDRPGPWCPIWYGESREGGVYAKLKAAMPDPSALEYLILGSPEARAEKLYAMADKIREANL